MDGNAMQPTTSATNCLQPQPTHAFGHTCPITHLNPQTMVHAHMVGLAVKILDDHTVIPNTPWFDGNHSLPTPLWCSTPSSNPSLLPSSWWCTGHTHTTLCTTSGFGKHSVVHAMCCHSTPFKQQEKKKTCLVLSTMLTSF